MGTRVMLVVGVGADDADCPVEALDAVGEEPADMVAAALGDAVADCAADVASAEADPEADELELCGLHPAMRTPATARAAPVSSVRRAALLVILFKSSQ
jgi:hypothetical protein